MGTAEKSIEVESQPKRKMRPLWVRFVHYSFRRYRKKKAEKKPETPVDRAARRTANATIWVALFTLVLALVSTFQWKEIHDGGKDTHELAVAAGKQAAWTQDLARNVQNQAEQTKHLAAEMRDQAGETRTIASQAITQAQAAQSAARTAKDALNISQRAYIVDGGVQVDWTRKVIFIPIENRGHVPSGQVHVILHISQFTKNPGGGTSVQMNWTESWLNSLTDSAPVTSPQITFNPVKARSGVQYFHIGIEIEYFDGFPETPLRRTQDTFCSFHPEANSFLFGPCPITNMLELLKKGDEYPNPKYQLNPGITPELLQPPIPTTP